MASKIITAQALRILAVLACLCLAECARPAPSKMLSVNQSANNSEISLSIGQQFEIALPENPTTGYVWEVVADGAPTSILRETKFESSSSRNRKN